MPCSGPARSIQTAAASNTAAASISPSTQKGRQTCTSGTASDVKNGTMRCATVTNTTTTPPHRPLRMQVRASSGAPQASASTVPASAALAAMHARPMARACSWSSARLCRTRRQNSAAVHARPSAATAAPASASAACSCAPASHTSHPSAWASKGASKLWAGKGATCSHLGPAVNMKPAKNSGMKPNTITAECTSEGASAGLRPSTPLLRSNCTSAHHRLAATSTTIARKNPSRCGASSR